MGSCLDPETAFVQGTDIFSDNLAMIDLYIELTDLFEPEMQVDLVMFYQYNIFDQTDPDKPIKSRLGQETLLISKFSYVYDLTLHNLELSDNIYSPFKS